MKVLLLGGTAEGRALASALVDAGVEVTTSLAGVTGRGADVPGEVRVGGFGGVAGLVDHLRAHEVARVVDATHPFAAQMTAHAAQACAATGVPLLRLQRASWRDLPGSGRWHWVPSVADALTCADRVAPGARPFLALGASAARDAAAWADRNVLLRVARRPAGVPAAWQVVEARGPFPYDSELALLRDARVGVLLSKDAGGPADAKLRAADDLDLPVVVIERPPLPAGVPVVATVEAAAAWAAAGAAG